MDFNAICFLILGLLTGFTLGSIRADYKKMETHDVPKIFKQNEY